MGAAESPDKDVLPADRRRPRAVPHLNFGLHYPS
jgi:hypothetical protein